MEGEIQLTLYRIEAIVKRVKSCIEELDKLQATAKMNLSFDENERLEKACQGSERELMVFAVTSALMVEVESLLQSLFFVNTLVEL